MCAFLCGRGGLGLEVVAAGELSFEGGVVVAGASSFVVIAAGELSFDGDEVVAAEASSFGDDVMAAD